MSDTVEVKIRVEREAAAALATPATAMRSAA
jgi:hypothetical protein